MGRVFFLFVGSAFLFACSQSNQQYDKAYFDFDSLINEQVTGLMNVDATLHKRATINGKTDSTSFFVDSLNLSNELDVFRQLDLINKPLYRNSYEIKDGEKDTRSNLLVRSYTAKAPSPVPFVKFYYQASTQEVKKIESVFHEANALYDTRRNLTLLFDDSRGSHLLSGFQLRGTQKMILSDSVSFLVSVTFAPGK
jgi:hypothetical protein